MVVARRSRHSKLASRNTNSRSTSELQRERCLPSSVVALPQIFCLHYKVDSILTAIFQRWTTHAIARGR